MIKKFRYENNYLYNFKYPTSLFQENGKAKIDRRKILKDEIL